MAVASDIEQRPPHHRRTHLVGRPLASNEVEETKLRKLVALPIFSSDALSSVAYATEAALGVLLIASGTSARLVLPISAAVAALMLIVVASYRQTVRAYPSSGGAYAVALDNLGANPALVAGAAILIDYLLTVAVSVSAGVFALTSAFPELHSSRVELALACVAVITIANLRGLRESGPVFALLTYAFVGSLTLTFAVAAGRFALGQHPHATVPHALPVGTGTIGVFLLLRAFASGASALTGVEAIANGTTAFRRPQARNAAITLGWLGGLACTLFLGVSILAVWLHARPSATASLLSQVAHAVWGSGPMGQAGYFAVQASTLAVLCLAANASFQGFPRLTALMARDRYMPRQFENLGDRLVYSNGVLVLALLSAALILIYDAQVNSLIHLYVVGVFCAFTLSQTGMVRYWLRTRGPGWRHSLAINTAGAAATGVVACVVIWTKFTEGAWMVVVTVPVLVVTFRGIKRHYRRLRRRLDAAVSGVAAVSITNRPVLLVERVDGVAKHAAWIAGRMAHEHQLRAVHSVAAPRRTAGGSGMGLDVGEAQTISSPEGVVDAVREFVWSLPHGGRDFVTVVIPEQFARASILDELRRPVFRLKLRLLQESGVALCDVSSTDALAGEAVPRRAAVRVLVSDARAASVRASAYAISLGFPDTRALHFATTAEKAERLRAAWTQQGNLLPLEVVESPFRDIAEPIRAYAHAMIDDDPELALVYVVPEIAVTGWRRLLHNFRELHIKRGVLFDSPRIILISVPYHLRG
jgi:amino acid transporter